MKRKILALCVAAAVTAAGMPSVSAVDAFPVRINEICSGNKKTLKDGKGNYSDYIELHNTSKKAVSLEGAGLSDNKDEPFSFRFPKGASIPAGGYVIVFCDDGKAGVKGEYHAPFKLSSGGETVYLTSPAKKSADKVKFPAMGEDMVYCRVNDGDKLALMTPTPAESNSSAKKTYFVQKPSFSAESGFYGKKFDLKISAPEDCEIYYTTDGSDPRTSKTAVKYEDKISVYDNTSEKNIASAEKNIALTDYTPPSFPVDKGMVIRAVCKNKKGMFGETVTKSYFVNKNAAYYKDMTVISVVTDSKNLFDPETGIYAVGSMYDKWKKSGSYKKTDPISSENVTNYNQSGKEWERPADVQIFRGGKQIASDSMGIRMVGNYSRSYPQKSFTFHARSEYGSSKIKYELFSGLTDSKGAKIKSFDSFTVRNGGNESAGSTTRMRDTLVSELSRGLEISAAASENCILFINGEFWGYYSMNEKLDESYFQAHYGIDKKNISIIKNWERSGDKKVTDSYISFYKWAVNADMKDGANYKKFCDTVDVKSFMDYIAVETYVCNNDWSNKEYVNNFMLWRASSPVKGNPFGDGKWRFAVFDSDMTAALYYSKETSSNYDSLGNMNTEKTWGNVSALFYVLMENKDFRKEFYERYRNVAENTFGYERVSKYVSAHSKEIKAASDATDRRFGNKNDFDRSVNHLLDFYRNRQKYALKYLDKLMENYE